MTAVSAHELTRTRDCVTPGCPEIALAGMEHCRRHAPVAALRAQREQREALEAMDNGEPQASATQRLVAQAESDRNGHRAEKPPAPARTRRPKWHSGQVVAAIKRWTAARGAPPTAEEWRIAGSWWPCYTTTVKVMGSWSEAMAAAGVKARPRGGTKRDFKSLSDSSTPNDESNGDGNKNVNISTPEISVDTPSGPEPLAPAITLVDPSPASDVPSEAASPTPAAVTTAEPGSSPEPFRLALTGDFHRDAERVRAEAHKLRRQADALDVIATGIDDLADTIT